MAPEIENKLKWYEVRGITACQKPLSFLLKHAFAQHMILECGSSETFVLTRRQLLNRREENSEGQCIKSMELSVATYGLHGFSGLY